MGRLKGSKNKKKSKSKRTIIKLKKYNKVKKVKALKYGYSKPIIEMPSNMKKYKFLGFCPKCDSIIIKNDLESKFIYTCPSCDKRARVSTLYKDKGDKSGKKVTLSKKEYLEDTINAEHLDSLPLIDPNAIDKI